MNALYVIGSILLLLGFIYFAGYLWTKASENAKFDFLVHKISELPDEEIDQVTDQTDVVNKNSSIKRETERRK